MLWDRKYCLLVRVIFASVFMLISTACLSAAQEEVITDFTSHIIVHADGSLMITETIQVVAAQNQIKHGIYRDFPTRYKDRLGNNVCVGFSIIDIEKDGRREPYHTKQLSNGIRVYIGSKDVTLSTGTYTYQIAYKTDRQIGFFKDFDELYWNVTGNDWSFPIQRVCAIVELSFNAPITQMDAYTGPFGAQGKDFRIENNQDGKLLFTTTRKLSPQEGLTIAVAWPKGFVHQPTTSERTKLFFADNERALAGILGILALLGYYLFVWMKVGKDPEKGVIIPRFAPPQGFSPASARFIIKMGYDQKTFTSAILNMAVNGHLRIEQDGGSDFTLVRTDNTGSSLSNIEKAMVEKLFPKGRLTLTLTQANHSRINETDKVLKNRLRTDFEKTYFFSNSKYLVPGVSITLLCLLIHVFLGGGLALTGIVLMFFLFFWTFVCFFLGHHIYSTWKIGGYIRAIPLCLFSMLFFYGELAILESLSKMLSFAASIALIILVGLNVFFYQLLKAPTLLGRKVLDELEGFKLYLGVAEKDRLNMLNPPEQTPELFEKFLPYAMALDVEQQWSEKFANVLAQAEQANSYHPTWYSGETPLRNLGTSMASSFTSTVSSASTPPGSSSGSSGGGSSGGGGGGGGGGGW